MQAKESAAAVPGNCNAVPAGKADDRNVRTQACNASRHRLVSLTVRWPCVTGFWRAAMEWRQRSQFLCAADFCRYVRHTLPMLGPHLLLAACKYQFSFRLEQCLPDLSVTDRHTHA